MSSAEVSRQAKVISELRVFIKKVLSDPTIAITSMDIARKFKDEPDASQKNCKCYFCSYYSQNS
jgi:hypothetical protein